MPLDHSGAAPTSLPPSEATEVAEFAYRLWNSPITQALVHEQPDTLESEAMFAICNQTGAATLRIYDREVPLAASPQDSRNLHHTILTLEGRLCTTQLQVYYFCSNEGDNIAATRVEGNSNDCIIPLPLSRLRQMAQLIMYMSAPRIPVSAETQDLLTYFDNRSEIHHEEARQFHHWVDLIWKRNQNSIESRDTKLLLFMREWEQGHWFDVEVEQARPTEASGITAPLEGWITDIHEESGKQIMLHIQHKNGEPVVTFMQPDAHDWKKVSVSLAERHRILRLIQEGFNIHIRRD